MKILVVGNGGREHAIAWSLLQSTEVEGVVCAPGNGGTAMMPRCENVEVKVDEFAQIAQIVEERAIDFVVVGPELPLSQGITDYLNTRNIAVFGPTKAGAKIEASKAWAKEIMLEAGVPTAQSQTFDQLEAAKDYINSTGAPIVIKADGLAAGKGVIVAQTVDEAIAGVDSLWQQGFRPIVVEEFLQGKEVSVLALTDGVSIVPLLPAQDHKRIGEGDTGKNTGGMGAYAPAPLATPQLMQQIETEVLRAAIATLRQQGIDYRGVLYAGLMIAPDGTPKVLEFNCRFGDPETQAILPLLQTPLHELMLACIQQRLGQMEIQWHKGSAACVVAAAPGYPDAYPKGMPISGIESAGQQALVFHAGTRIEQQLVCDGGRVLAVAAVAASLPSALERAYAAIEQIQFEGIYYRRDIGRSATS